MTKTSSEHTVHPYTQMEIGTKHMDKRFLFWVNRDNREEFLLDNERMKGQYLGACLDYVRDGGMNACFWEVQEKGTKGIISFIKDWMQLNNENLIWTDQKEEHLALPKQNQSILSLEKILNRLRVGPTTRREYCTPFGTCKKDKERLEIHCLGHEQPHPTVAYPFDGWILASYAKLWHQQVPEGKAPLFNEKDDKDTYRRWPGFRFISD